MKKKLLFVIDSLQVGGAEKSLLSVLSLIDKSRYAVDVLMNARGGAFEQFLPPEVHILELLPFMKFMPLPAVRQLFTFDFRKILARARLYKNSRNNPANTHGAQVFWRSCAQAIEPLPQAYDIAIAYHQGLPTYFVAEKVRAGSKIAWVNTDYQKAGYNPAFDADKYAKFNRIVFVSGHARASFAAAFPSLHGEYMLIHDILDSGLILNMSKADGVDFAMGNKLRIVTVGRLVKPKGYDIALDAANLLAQNGMDFEWFFVGEGDERGNIETYIASNKLQDFVKLTGSLPNPYPLLHSADIYVHTARFEGFGLSVAEAKILDVPVISTDFETIHSQIADGENGLIVSMDGASVYRAILRLATDQHLYRHIRGNLARGKKGNVEEFSKIDGMLRELLHD